jgi:ankyrin repeat protein
MAPLHEAVIRGNENVVGVLLQNKEIRCGVDTKDNRGRTALHWVAENGNEAIARMLVEQGADISAEDKHKDTPLHCAARRVHETIVQMLIEKSASVKATNEDGQTALDLAAERNHEATKMLLLRAWAAQEGDADVFRQLLNEGEVLVDYKDRDSRTLLSYAAELGHEPLVKLLLEKGAELESEDGGPRRRWHGLQREGTRRW